MSILGGARPFLSADNSKFFAFESLLICFSVWISRSLAWPNSITPENVLWSLLIPMGAIALVVQTTFYYNGLYDKASFTAVEVTVKVAASLIIASGVLTVAYYALPQIMIGRFYFAVSFTTCAVLLCAERLCQIYFFRNGKFSQRIVIVGTGSRAMEVARLIAQKKDSGYTLLGFVESDEEWTARKQRVSSSQTAPVLTLITGSEPGADEPEPGAGNVSDIKRRWAWTRR